MVKPRKSGPPTGAAAMYPSTAPAAPLWAAEADAVFLADPADPQTRIAQIRQGIPAAAVGHLSARMGISKEVMLASLGLPRATISRKEKQAAVLSKDESERVLGFEVLIDTVQTMVAQSGDAASAAGQGGFDAAHWLAQWLTHPLPALGGATPASYMDTFEGQRLVGNLLVTMQTGAYA